MTNLMRTLRAAALVATATAMTFGAAHAATFQIVNNDNPNEGFNDGTVVAPIGGNPGTTRGAQRINVFNQAAAVWGGLLPSTVTIRVASTFDPITIPACTATGGVLGSTGALAAANNFTNAPLADTWYPIAFANKFEGTDIDPTGDDMQSRFNSDVDNATCLGTSNWYYGYDHNEGIHIDLFAVVLHELAHGLGFATFTNLATGVFFMGLTDVYAHHLFDETQQLGWEQMSNAQRVASAINSGNLVFNSPLVRGHAPQFLNPPRPVVRINDPAAIAGEKQYGTAQFSPALAPPLRTAEVILVNDGVAPTSDGCEDPYVNAAALNGKIALIDRGLCNFNAKALAAENNGAIALLIANNVAGAPPLMGGVEPVSIPTVSLTLADGNAIKNALLSGPVIASIGGDPNRDAGTHGSSMQVLLYAPNPLQQGSSVSHFDISATPNLLMEPAINSDLTSSVDLTRYAFQEMGWLPGEVSVDPQVPMSLRLETGAPNPFRVRTSIRYTMARPGFTEMAIYDVGGRLVKSLLKSWQPSGSGQIVWDATNDRGDRVEPGVYLYMVRVNGEKTTQRVVVAD